MPERIKGADDDEISKPYELPQAIFGEPMNLSRYRAAHERGPHRVYRRALAVRRPKRAMIFFLQDELIVAGIAITTSADSFARDLLARLLRWVAATAGEIYCERSSPGNGCGAREARAMMT